MELVVGISNTTNNRKSWKAGHGKKDNQHNDSQFTVDLLIDLYSSSLPSPTFFSSFLRLFIKNIKNKLKFIKEIISLKKNLYPYKKYDKI